MRNENFIRLPQVLTPYQCGEMCRALGNLKHRCMVQMMYECGLRLSEVTAIKVKHVEGTQARIYIEESKGAKDRYVPITDRLLCLLRMYWKTYRPGKGDAWLFPSETDKQKQYAARTLQYLVAKAGARAGIHRHVNPHLLRHSRATHWINAGMDIYHVAMLLGHASVATTQIYLHTATERLFEVARDTDKIIYGSMAKEARIAAYT